MTVLLDRLRATIHIIACRMRSARWRIAGAQLSGKVNVGSRLRMPRAAGVKIGRRTTIEDDVYLKLVTHGAKLLIGEYVFLGRGVEIDCSLLVEIGAHTQIAPSVFITDHSHGIAAAVLIDTQPITSAPVAIGRDVWIGTGAVILAGVSIADEAIVGANAVVRHNVGTREIVAGVPARMIGRRT